MEQRIIEGTWEEVARRGDELAGRRVRLTVLDELTTPAAHERATAAMPIPEDLIDVEFVADCEKKSDGQDIPSIDEVRKRLAKIPGSFSQQIIADREDRF
jgi:hypothetical protein